MRMIMSMQKIITKREKNRMVKVSILLKKRNRKKAIKKKINLSATLDAILDGE